MDVEHNQAFYSKSKKPQCRHLNVLVPQRPKEAGFQISQKKHSQSIDLEHRSESKHREERSVVTVKRLTLNILLDTEACWRFEQLTTRSLKNNNNNNRILFTDRTTVDRWQAPRPSPNFWRKSGCWFPDGYLIRQLLECIPPSITLHLQHSTPEMQLINSLGC